MNQEIEIDGYPFKRYRFKDGEWGFREPSYRLVKMYLVDKYGVCWFCQKPVKLHEIVDGQGQPHDHATIDHIVPRRHSHTKTPNAEYRIKHSVVEKVLACYACNQARNEAYRKGKPRCE